MDLKSLKQRTSATLKNKWQIMGVHDYICLEEPDKILCNISSKIITE